MQLSKNDNRKVWLQELMKTTNFGELLFKAHTFAPSLTTQHRSSDSDCPYKCLEQKVTINMIFLCKSFWTNFWNHLKLKSQWHPSEWVEVTSTNSVEETRNKMVSHSHCCCSHLTHSPQEWCSPCCAPPSCVSTMCMWGMTLCNQSWHFCLWSNRTCVDLTTHTDCCGILCPFITLMTFTLFLAQGHITVTLMTSVDTATQVHSWLAPKHSSCASFALLHFAEGSKNLVLHKWKMNTDCKETKCVVDDWSKSFFQQSLQQAFLGSLLHLSRNTDECWVHSGLEPSHVAPTLLQ